MTNTPEDRWWQNIIRFEPQLNSEEAKTEIEAALTRYRNVLAAPKKRKGKSPWAFDYEDAAKMKQRVEELRQDIQPYLPKGVGEFNETVRQTIAGLDVVAKYLGRLESEAKLNAKQGGREREITLQWLVYELGLIREQITEKKLDRKIPSRRYIYACLDGLGVQRKTIDVAITYIHYHPDQFFPHGIR